MGIALGAGLVALVALGGLLWSRFNPEPVDSHKIDPPPVSREEKPEIDSPPDSSPPSKADSAAIAETKARAEAEFGAFLEIKNTLTTKGVERWGGPAWSEILQLNRDADAWIIAQDYAAAAMAYEKAKRNADRLLDGMPDIFQSLVAGGESALARGDGVSAREKFEIALLINPDHPGTRKSYKRAQTLDEVEKLVATGAGHEDNEKFALAYADYQKALSLDALHPAARDGLLRVEKMLKTDRFKSLMSQGMAALHTGDLKTARDRLMKAKTFEPGAPAVLDALKQLEEAELTSKVDALQRQALAAEQAEKWDRALKTYEAMLRLDPTVQSAIQGQQRAQEYLYVSKRLDYYLNHPDALTADQQLQNALALQAEIASMNIAGPDFRARIDRFEKILTAAQTPVRIIIQSDDLTRVAVYRVGKLGHFLEHRLKLRPGVYTVVGSRDGYQDVRQKLVVTAGQSEVKIDIRCVNKL